mmetsp:Transcript_108229/g.312807  ORF Transcript_108229/g.312807 Transcript_108229/m.312807 type:complete len:96 (-) Transcript_108229:248-535(-)
MISYTSSTTPSKLSWTSALVRAVGSALALIIVSRRIEFEAINSLASSLGAFQCVNVHIIRIQFHHVTLIVSLFILFLVFIDKHDLVDLAASPPVT